MCVVNSRFGKMTNSVQNVPSPSLSYTTRIVRFVTEIGGAGQVREQLTKREKASLNSETWFSVNESACKRFVRICKSREEKDRNPPSVRSRGKREFWSSGGWGSVRRWSETEGAS